MKWILNYNLELLLIPALLGLALVDCSKNETEIEGIQSDLKNNSTIEGNSTSEIVESSRNSRQLWSFVKKVIKTSLDQPNNNGNGNPVSGAMGGALSSLFSSGIANAISSASSTASNLNQNPYLHQPQQQQQLNHLQHTNPNDYMHYLLLNSQAQQHTSLPHYHQQQQHHNNQQMDASTSNLIQKYQEQMTSSTNNQETVSTTGNQILSKLALGSMLEDFDLENVANFLSFGTFERMVEKVNRFDKLKCIPRLLCQMVAKRHEDAKKSEATSTTTTTKRPGKKAKKRRSDDDEVVGKEKKSKKESDEESAEDDDDDDDNDDDESEEERVVIKPGGGSGRSGRFLKVDGADTALEQFVKFLELMQLKDWSLYPYLQGAYQGSQVGRTEDCAHRFASCPFSDEQLVYYFNNYNGGFFQSI
ncbi:unnamed protein product [Orchesella dallaii]|uniref:Uncharacterized protein n=1 Tax=Orchesella dallaii TaxID=48710 RepID=A0ABP1Q6B4_9HEXA